MNSSLKNKESIRDYLLGRVTEESLLSELEELLFMDEEFCTEVEIAEDQLINDYVFDRLDPDDKADFEKTLANNPERRQSVQLATALKEKARTATAPVPQKVGFFESLTAFFKQPLYAAGFAVALIGIVIFSYVILSRKTTNELAELQGIYKYQRQTETRISGFDYAPMAIVRGEDKKEDDQRKLRRIELAWIEASERNPGAKAHHDLGVFYLNERDFPKAIKYFDLAVKADAGNATFRNDLGSAYFELGKLANGEKKFEDLARALEEFSRALALNPDLLESLFNKSLALEESGLPDRAKESWNQYLGKDVSSKWAEEARKHLAELDQKQSNLRSKQQVLEDFLAAFKKKDDETAWKINSQTRDVYFGVWLPDQLSRSYINAKLRGDPETQDESLRALTYIGTLEKERNADFFVSDLAAILPGIDRVNSKKLSEAQTSFDQGLLLSQQTTYKPAIAAFNKSAQLFSEAGDPSSEKFAQFWIMQCLSALGRLQEGLTKSEEILDFARKKKYKWLEASVKYFTGIILMRQNEITKALDSYLAARASAQSLDDRLLEQRCNNMIVENLIETGQTRKALKYQFGEAAGPYYSSEYYLWKNYEWATNILIKLKLYGAAGEYASASLEAARNVRPEIPDIVSSALLLLEEVKTADQKLDEALTLANESLAIIESKPDTGHKSARKGDNIARIAALKDRLGRCDEAVTDFNNAITIFQNIPEFRLDEYTSHRGLLMCLKKLGRANELRSELGIVLSLADDNRKQILDDESRQSFFDNEQAVFDVAIEDSLARGDSTEAFQRAERSKARSLLDIISSERSIESLQKEVYQVAEPMSLEEIRAEMPANSQVVEYALLEDRLVAWIISKDSLQTIDLKIDGARLKKSIEDLAGFERNRNSTATERSFASSGLYTTLVGPLSKFLEPAKTLVIVPDKSLYYVPFASLIDSDGRFLVQQFAISYSPSATIFISASKKGASFAARKPGKLLAIGDPAFNRETYPGLAPLDAARTEARDIASMISNSRVLTGEEATKENFLRFIGDAGILHFAGHYLPDQDAPSRSKLIFANARENSDLQMSEIAEKKLPNMNLVVLSACETGIENVLEGEGLISASRAFLAAGVPVVVASQWKVDSEATEKLMVAFHRNRLQKGMNSAAALRQAQLEMIEAQPGPFASPYFWAAFSVIGGLES